MSEPSHSPLCRATWMDAVRGDHLVIRRDDPVELRFGLRTEPGFWDVASTTGIGVVSFWSLRNGDRFFSFEQLFGVNTMPGAGSEELWMGVQLGSAGTLAQRRPTDLRPNAIHSFRAQVWFRRNPHVGELSEFATTGEHSFALEDGGGDTFFSPDHRRLVGGPGRPTEPGPV
jgi:hypothetical protein